MSWLIAGLVFWAMAWVFNVWIARSAWADSLAARIIVPVLFGFTLVILWEALVRHFNVSQVILPPPSMVAQTFAASTDILWQDFRQTVLKGALSGYIIGALAAFGTAVLIDRSRFLTRGLLPVGNFVAAL
ncbi:MAG: ABC transporter permease, partial [Paracoccaceae bacterium]